ncbi:hypothetical protein BH10BAC5_BH10BAC5_20550 [soil metagenome]
MKIALFLAAFLFLSQVSFSQTLNISSDSITDKSESSKYEIHVSYPSFDFGPEALMGMRGVAGDMNSELKDIIMSRVDTFRSFAKGNLKDLKEYNSEILKEDINSYLEIGYEVNCISNNFISIYFFQEEYILGMAHPNHYSFSFNSDLGEKKLDLSDIFLPNSEYLREISKYARTDLKKQFKEMGIEDSDLSMLNDGTTPIIENFQTWGINGNDLVIHFDNYAVGPYAIGSFDVYIPKEKLEKSINKNVDVWGKCR